MTLSFGADARLSPSRCTRTVKVPPHRVVSRIDPRRAAHLLAGLALVVVAGAIVYRLVPEKLSVRGDVYRVCRDFTAAKLKAPATAVFPNLKELERLRDYGFKKDNGRAYELLGYVDSENSFGAMLRTDFSCVVERRGSSWVGSSTLIPRE